MRYVAKLELHNFGPFKGTHTLELGPTVYAVVAQHEEDVDRSNWIGKTWFLSSMLFALTGQKPETCKTEDGLITDGEDAMYVKLTADDGTFIHRSRKRTRSTQLEVTLPGGKLQKQTVAQDNLYDAMGLNADDLLATAFIRQKHIARLITADPAERAAIVNGWLELEPLQLAEQWVRKQYNDLLEEERNLSPGDAPDGDLEELRKEHADACYNRDRATEERDDAQGDVAALVQHQRHQDNANELDEVRVDGVKLRARVDAYVEPDLHALDQDATEAHGHKSRALDREHELKQLVRGEWDKVCPLTCEECPVSGEVEAHGASMDMELSEAEIVLDEADRDATTAKEAATKAHGAHRDHEAASTRLVRLRARGEALLPSAAYITEHGSPASADEHQTKLQALNAEVREYTQEASTLAARIQAHEKHAEATQKVAERRAELEGELRTHREALAVVGRLGAQKEIAELALGRIQRGANQRLTQAGIELSVDVRWAREGRGLATHCDACGTAYPKSLKVKVCDICGAARGPKLVEKMEIQPSDRSGAADDICGLVFQLSASAWLRTKRAASWASACIDEPFASLDKANSRALGTHLHALIRGNNDFMQGFLVAHDATAMESLPARIQIYGSAEGASLEVIE